MSTCPIERGGRRSSRRHTTATRSASSCWPRRVRTSATRTMTVRRRTRARRTVGTPTAWSSCSAVPSGDRSEAYAFRLACTSARPSGRGAPGSCTEQIQSRMRKHDAKARALLKKRIMKLVRAFRDAPEPRALVGWTHRTSVVAATDCMLRLHVAALYVRCVHAPKMPLPMERSATTHPECISAVRS